MDAGSLLGLHSSLSVLKTFEQEKKMNLETLLNFLKRYGFRPIEEKTWVEFLRRKRGQYAAQSFTVDMRVEEIVYAFVDLLTLHTPYEIAKLFVLKVHAIREYQVLREQGEMFHPPKPPRLIPSGPGDWSMRP